MSQAFRNMPTARVWATVRHLGRQRVLGAPGEASPAMVAAETDAIMVELNRVMSYASAPADFVAGKLAEGTRSLADLAAYCFRVGYTAQGEAIRTLADSTSAAARSIGSGAGDGAAEFFGGVAEGQKQIVSNFLPIVIIGGAVVLVSLWSPALLAVGRQVPMVIRSLRPV